ncbi:hypothetical protein AKJ37_00090 [candidate division MSBL1 archaeon SCGC-AAA259I09]|uniref:Phenylalanine--tRNA ligase alpha subunit n=2 Tax=candidate division MSBL1 TaxID=215777 RepID=A0A133UW49_9EURY|nr:hypothetical protein AKJ61_00500 [candidate division MSBL1 archaeon SCGC-AAA259B11]KXA98425.1 hypothetical protein AKJ37_00090 [candidate division MSBL1 archaeon SCGC-AAA259I09]
MLSALGELNHEAFVEKIQETTELSQSSIMRSALSLEENNFLKLHEKNRKQIFITEEGKNYLKNSLPERKILNKLAEENSLPVVELAGRIDLPEEKIGLAIGWVKRKNWGKIEQENGEKNLTITDNGIESLEQKGKDELLLEKFENSEKIFLDSVPEDLKNEVSKLRSRNLIRTKKRTRRKLSLTEKGKKSLNLDLGVIERVSRLSSDLIRTGKWREVELRDYNVTAPTPSIHPGKEHPQRRIIEELRSILLRMGFEEITGPIVESEFWNFDALFQAQNHPAREIHDTLSLSKPKRVQNLDGELLERVKEAHEEGVAGSTGWGYKFDKETSHRTILRSQTTADTVRYLAQKPEPPVKVFCIDKVFRRERIDYQHLAEFPQAEGIVMAEDLNFRHMLGYLKQILIEMGISKIRFRPGYFPYTEPSAEADGYFPERDEWIELLGAGMFRPELLEPLDIDHPVLAWGIGFSRIAMIRMGIEDMRDLHNNDINWLKSRPLG